MENTIIKSDAQAHKIFANKIPISMSNISQIHLEVEYQRDYVTQRTLNTFLFQQLIA